MATLLTIVLYRGGYTAFRVHPAFLSARMKCVPACAILWNAGS